MSITENQSDVVGFLASPSTHGDLRVEQIPTHISVVFLAGDRAYKLKRAVHFDYVDFSTVDRRREACEAEVRLNLRTAPDLYRGVVPVCRQPSGALALAGSGTPVDWLVEMNRFDQALLLDWLASRDDLGVGVMETLAASIARFHRDAGVRTDCGGRRGLEWVVEGNRAGFAEFGGGVLDREQCARVVELTRVELDRHATLLDERRDAGRVRQCHGDLHLRNIVMLDGRPTLFDAVEFNDNISCIDIGYDVAFLLMDLWRRQLPRHANVVLNRYLAETGDLGMLPLLPLFLSCRAAVRAKTSATSAAMEGGEASRVAAADYLALAERFLHPPRPCLIAIGGLSGSGKSTVAAALAPSVGAAPGAMVFRSDAIRKRLFGVPALQPLGRDAYSTAVNERVYDALLEAARQALRAGHAAIVDAVFAHAEQRKAIERVARETGIPFVGCWLDAPEPALIARVEQRRDDPSDADARVVRLQRRLDTGLVEWHWVDASLARADVLDEVRRFMPRESLLELETK